MSCRRVESLLSAFVDSELTGFEMLSIKRHLSECSRCEAEYESIASLKRLLNSLPISRPSTELSTSLEELSSCSLIAVQLFRPQREIRRILGLASAEENSRAMQQANGHFAGLACALGVLGAWFVVAPAAMAPVLSNLQSSHSRLQSFFSGAVLHGIPRKFQPNLLSESTSGSLIPLEETNLSVPQPPSAPASYSGDARIITLGYSEASSYQIRPVFNTMSLDSSILSATPRARYYAANFNASR